MLWDEVKQSLREALSESEYGLWIKPLSCLREDTELLELGGPDRFFCAWIRDRYLEIISRQVVAARGSSVEVKLSVAAAPAAADSACGKGQLRLPTMPVGGSRIRSLHPRYVFDEFMVGESNMLAQSACEALAGGDDSYGTCLYLNSSTGLGKSHLTQAVAHRIINTSPATRLHYLTAQQFSAEMVKGIRGNTMDQFKNKYLHHCDMLLVEDVQTLTGKTKTQEELNEILDYLIKSGKRVILTSAVEPQTLEGIDSEFRSRMTAGLVARIKAPDLATRVNIIQHKAAGSGLELDDELVDYLARHVSGDVRRIESALIGIKAKSRLMGIVPDLCMVKEVVRGLIGLSQELSAVMIRDLVSDQFKVSVGDLQSRSRKKAITFPRQVAMYLSRKYTDESLADIGQLYNRDHSTVLYAIRKVTEKMARNACVRGQVNMLCSKLKENS